MNFVNFYKDCLTFSGKTDEPREIYHDVSFSNDLAQIFNFPVQIRHCDACLQSCWLGFFLSPDPEPLCMLLSQFLGFPFSQKEMSLFIAQLLFIWVLIGMVFVIMLGMLYQIIASIWVLLLVPLNFVSGSCWSWWIYTSLKVAGQASLFSLVFSSLCYWHYS